MKNSEITCHKCHRTARWLVHIHPSANPPVVVIMSSPVQSCGSCLHQAVMQVSKGGLYPVVVKEGTDE